MGFGDFPGPERIPREAVVMGSNIIISRNGSAGDNNIDVPIPDFMKVDAMDENIPVIIDTLEDMLNNYDKFYHYYDDYRSKIWEQRILFEDNKIIINRIVVLWKEQILQIDVI